LNAIGGHVKTMKEAFSPRTTGGFPWKEGLRPGKGRSTGEGPTFFHSVIAVI